MAAGVAAGGYTPAAIGGYGAYPTPFGAGVAPTRGGYRGRGAWRGGYRGIRGGRGRGRGLAMGRGRGRGRGASTAVGIPRGASIAALSGGTRGRGRGRGGISANREKCRFGDRCGRIECPFQHDVPLCKFGLRCTRLDNIDPDERCKFRHIKKGAVVWRGRDGKMVANPKAAAAGAAGAEVKIPAGAVCRFDKHCQRIGCAYAHPERDAKAKSFGIVRLKSKFSNILQGKSQAESKSAESTTQSTAALSPTPTPSSAPNHQANGQNASPKPSPSSSSDMKDSEEIPIIPDFPPPGEDIEGENGVAGASASSGATPRKRRKRRRINDPNYVPVRILLCVLQWIFFFF